MQLRLKNALRDLRDGDELVVTELDRLGRSLRELLDIADEIRTKGSALTVGHTTYDPADPAGAMMFQVLGMAAEFDLSWAAIRGDRVWTSREIR